MMNDGDHSSIFVSDKLSFLRAGSLPNGPSESPVIAAEFQEPRQMWFPFCSMFLKSKSKVPSSRVKN
jgi:hypothetical protein